MGEDVAVVGKIPNARADRARPRLENLDLPANVRARLDQLLAQWLLKSSGFAPPHVEHDSGAQATSPYFSMTATSRPRPIRQGRRYFEFRRVHHKGTKDTKSEDNSSYAVLEQLGVEIHQEAKAMTG
jgi:hypothetical protein